MPSSEARRRSWVLARRRWSIARWWTMPRTHVRTEPRRGRSGRRSARWRGRPPGRRPRPGCGCRSCGGRARRTRWRGARRRARRREASPRRTSCISSSSARWESDMPAPRYAAPGVRISGGRGARRGGRRGAGAASRRARRASSSAARSARPGELDRRPALRVAALLRGADAQDDQPRPGRGPDRGGGDRPHPVARVAHRRELPGVELLGRGLGERRQRRLQARRQVGGRLDGRQRAAQERLEVRAACSLTSSASLPCRDDLLELLDRAVEQHLRGPVACAPSPGRSRGCPCPARSA